MVATRCLFTAAAVAWLALGVLVGLGAVSVGPVPHEFVGVLAVLLVLGALVMAALAWRSLRGDPWIDLFALAAAILNVLVTFGDDIGAIDIAYLVFSLTLLGALVWALVARRSA